MCLNSLSSNCHKPNAYGVGWKVFLRTKKRLIPEFGSNVRPYDIGSWYTSYAFSPEDKRDVYCPSQGNPNLKSYWRGFHVFLRYADARAWGAWASKHKSEIRRVEWRSELARGIQLDYSGSRPVVVAKEIRIIPKRQEARLHLPTLL